MLLTTLFLVVISALTVICVLAVLPEIMLIEKLLLHTVSHRVHSLSMEIHKGYLFENYGIVYRLVNGYASESSNFLLKLLYVYLSSVVGKRRTGSHKKVSVGREDYFVVLKVKGFDKALSELRKVE